jgi:hypothetical protein
MIAISGLQLRPNVGDLVEVYRDSSLSIELQVVGCRWTFTNGADPILHCELHIAKGHWNHLPHFIEVMKQHNIY